MENMILMSYREVSSTLCINSKVKKCNVLLLVNDEKKNLDGAILDALRQFWTRSGSPLKQHGSVDVSDSICSTNHDKHTVKYLYGYMDICGFYGPKSSFAPTFRFGAEACVRFCLKMKWGIVQFCLTIHSMDIIYGGRLTIVVESHFGILITFLFHMHEIIFLLK